VISFIKKIFIDFFIGSDHCKRCPWRYDDNGNCYANVWEIECRCYWCKFHREGCDRIDWSKCKIGINEAIYFEPLYGRKIHPNVENKIKRMG